MKSLKLKLKVKNLTGKRLWFLISILVLELGFWALRSFLSSGFTVFGLPERVFVAAEGEFLYQTFKGEAFKAFLGDRAAPGRPRLRLERAGTTLELSLQGDPLEKQVMPEPTPNLPDQPNSTSSARLEKLRTEAHARLSQERAQISSEAGQRLGQIEAQVKDISLQLESISSGLESIETQSAQIEAAVERLVGQTFIAVEDGKEVIQTNEVLPGADISQQVIDQGIRQKISFKAPPPDSTLHFELNLEGLEATPDDDGNWRFLAESGHPLLTLAPPVLEDAAGAQGAVTLEISPSSPPPPPNPPPTTHPSTPLGASYSLLVSLDPSWLASPDRVYPVSLKQDILAVLTAEELSTTVRGSFDKALLLALEAFNPDRNPGHACQIEPFSSRLSPGEETALKVSFSPSDPQLAFGFKVGSLPQGISASFGTIDQASFSLPLNIVVADNPPQGSFSLVVAYQEGRDSTSVAKTICQFNLVIE